mgnify:CR=1 FL=1
MIYTFRDIILDTVERSLIKGEMPIPLTPRAFDILQVLIEADGKIVTRDELFGKVWGGACVEEGNLNVQMSKIRKPLENLPANVLLKPYPTPATALLLQLQNSPIIVTQRQMHSFTTKGVTIS